MKNILPAFIRGESKSEKTARAENGIFYSYATPIAKLLGGTVFLRSRKYSNTTSTQQNAIREFCTIKGIRLIECEESTFWRAFQNQPFPF